MSSSSLYPTVIVRDPLSDGKPWFVAYHPDLPGCMADGPTAQSALQELDDVRAAFIALMIENEVPVPAPPVASNARTISAAASGHPAVLTDEYRVVESTSPDVQVRTEPRLASAAD